MNLAERIRQKKEGNNPKGETLTDVFSTARGKRGLSP